MPFFWVDDFWLTGQVAVRVNASWYQMRSMFSLIVKNKFIYEESFTEDYIVFGHVPHLRTKDKYRVWKRIAAANGYHFNRDRLWWLKKDCVWLVDCELDTHSSLRVKIVVTFTASTLSGGSIYNEHNCKCTISGTKSARIGQKTGRRWKRLFIVPVDSQMQSFKCNRLSVIKPESRIITARIKNRRVSKRKQHYRNVPKRFFRLRRAELWSSSTAATEFRNASCVCLGNFVQ